MVWTNRHSPAGMSKTSSLSQNVHPDSRNQLASCEIMTERSFLKVKAAGLCSRALTPT
jgi:hypothetical protein